MARSELSPMHETERQLLSRNLPVLRESLYQPRPLTFTDKAFLPWMTATLTNTLWSQQIVNAESVWRSIEEQATQNSWFEGEGRPGLIACQRGCLELAVLALPPLAASASCRSPLPRCQCPPRSLASAVAAALNLERTFITEHSMLALHVWLVHKRFMLDFHNRGLFCGRSADKELFQVFWDDTLNRIRNVGVTEVSVNKQLENVQKATFVDMLEYDAAVRRDDDNMELSAALFKGVFQGDEAARVEDVIALADWVRNELLAVVTQPAEDVYRGWITWSPALGEDAGGRLARQRQLFEGEWREEVQVDGKLTFWHTATREIRKGDDVPAEGLTRRRNFALASHLKALADEGRVDRALVNPEGLRALAAVEAGVARDGVVIEAGDEQASPAIGAAPADDAGRP